MGLWFGYEMYPKSSGLSSWSKLLVVFGELEAFGSRAWLEGIGHWGNVLWEMLSLALPCLCHHEVKFFSHTSHHHHVLPKHIRTNDYWQNSEIKSYSGMCFGHINGEIKKNKLIQLAFDFKDKFGGWHTSKWRYVADLRWMEIIDCKCSVNG